MLTFVFCVEPGRLESEAILLVDSIRHFGGRHAGAAIFAVQPRGNEPLRAETLQAFAFHGVIHRAAVLNTDYARWPTTNKVYAIASVEKRATTPYLVFVDTDSVIVNEPSEFVLAEGVDLAVQPTVRQLRGSTGPGDANDAFWLQVYRTCGVPEPHYVLTMLDRVAIRGYYNGGLVVMRRSASLGKRWLELLRRIGPSLPEDIRYNLDQIALAAVAAGIQNQVHVLPAQYNYNISRRGQFVLDAPRLVKLEQLVHVHYHAAFREIGFLYTVQPQLDPTSERFRWLAERLPLKAD
jgi:hypothetical protein